MLLAEQLGHGRALLDPWVSMDIPVEEGDDKEAMEKLNRPRPHVVMFGDDYDFRGDTKFSKINSDYQRWIGAVERFDCVKLVVIEIGCGEQVRTVRTEAEDIVREFNCSERWPQRTNERELKGEWKRAKLVRINPEKMPEGGFDERMIFDDGRYGDGVAAEDLLWINELGAKAALLRLDSMIEGTWKA